MGLISSGLLLQEKKNIKNVVNNTAHFTISENMPFILQSYH
jgi:hypothetical protein